MSINTIDLTSWTKQSSSPFYDHNYHSSSRPPPPPASSSMTYVIPISIGAIWVSGAGNDTTGDGTQSTPYATLRKAVSDLSGAGEVCIADGIYNIADADKTDWMVNDRSSSGYAALPSGTGWATKDGDGFPTVHTNMVLIRAETAFGVRLNFTESLAWYDAFFNTETAEYIRVDGFILDFADTGGTLASSNSLGDNCYMSRCIVKRAGNPSEASWVFVHGNDSLVEQCFGVGATRYGFGTGGTTSAQQRNVFRACLGRYDFSELQQPSSTFNHYGNNDATYYTGNSAWLNCIDIDANEPGFRDDNKRRWGSIYNPKNCDNVATKGFLSLNCPTGHAALYQGEQNAQNMTSDHCVIWDNNGGTGGDGFRHNGSGGSGGNSATNFTIGDVQANFNYVLNVIDATGILNDALNGTDKTILYQSDGADIRYLYGGLGDRHGDTGYATKSVTKMWPFAYEDTIKSVFAESQTPAAGYLPVSNTTNRGFCLSTSLTDYIIEYVDSGAVIGDVY